MNPALVSLLAEQMPSIIAGVKALFARRNPNAPAVTDADIHAAFEEAYTTSKAVNAEWLKNHPEAP